MVTFELATSESPCSISGTVITKKKKKKERKKKLFSEIVFSEFSLGTHKINISGTLQFLIMLVPKEKRMKLVL